MLVSSSTETDIKLNRYFNESEEFRKFTMFSFFASNSLALRLNDKCGLSKFYEAAEKEKYNMDVIIFSYKNKLSTNDRITFLIIMANSFLSLFDKLGNDKIFNNILVRSNFVFIAITSKTMDAFHAKK
jgi:hypothetical protein